MRNFFALIVLLSTVVLFDACKKDNDYDSAAQNAIDQPIIKKYIQDNNLDMIEHETGIHYSISEIGTGKHPTVNNKISAYYKGALLDGTIFDQTDINAREFFLYNTILGWQVGIPLLKSGGGKGTFIIPSYLAYQNTTRSSIPANSILIFEVNLVDILN